MKCHEVDYEIIGETMQIVEIELDPQEVVVAEAGMMSYMEDHIHFETKMGDGAEPDQSFFSKAFSAGKRLLTGESLFMTHFTNHGKGKRRVSFAAPYPGSIIAINMQDINETLICQKDSFLAAAFGTKIGIVFNKRLGAGLFGGEGFILQKVEGDGMVFIHAGGTVVRKELNNETIRLDTGCLVGFTQGISYDIEVVSGLKSMLFGGEGICLATLSGTGSVWIQSLPLSRLADRILANVPGGISSGQGEGSVLGGIGNVLGGK